MSSGLTIRVSFLTFPTEPAVEEWTFSADADPDFGGPAVDELALESALWELFVEAGGGNTLSIRREATRGGWGAYGLSVLQIAVSVGTGIATNLLWAAMVRVFNEYVKVEPKTTRVQAAEEAPAQLAAQPAKRRPKKKVKGNPKPKGRPRKKR
jgi:hypothetical protein